MTRRILMAVLLLVFVLSAFSAPRRVLYEHFTSTTCGPCAAWEPHLDAFVSSYDHDEIVKVSYHVGWPGAGSYFYHPNPTPVDAVVAFYSVSGVPSMWFDAVSPDFGGATTYDEVMAIFRARVDSRLEAGSPIDINLDFSGGAIDITIDVEEALTGSHVVRFYITEDDLRYTAPNGLTNFSQVFREAYPNYGGTAVDLSSVGSVDVNVPYTIDGSWNAAKLNAIVFVQNTVTQDIINSQKATIPAPDFFFTLTPEAVSYTGMYDEDLILLEGDLCNVGSEDDTYDIHITGDYTEGWLISWCSGDLCLPETATGEVHLVTGACEHLSVDVSPMGIVGEGTFSMIVQSRGSGVADTMTFFLRTLAGGADVLLVADEADFGGADVDNSPYYTRVLDALGVHYDIYDRDDGPIDYAYFSSFRSVIWYTGATYVDILDDDDQILVERYLTEGGRLLMSSSDLAWDLVANRDATAWYETHFHNRFNPSTDDEASSNSFSGIVEPYMGISDDLVALSESNFSRYHDIMHPIHPAVAILAYDGTSPVEHAGIIWEGGATKLAYLGFGMEYMSSDVQRQNLMQLLLLDFLLEDVKESIVQVPQDFAIVGNYPNPFNPATEIEYRIDNPGYANLQVVDALGRHVTTLVDEHKEAGVHVVRWNGINDYGRSMPSGLYLMKLTVGNETATKSLLLAK